MSKRSFLLLTSAALTLILLTSHSPVKSQGELPQANADTFDVHFFITSPNPNVLANDTPVNGNLQVQYMQPVYTSLGVATVGWNGAVGFTSYGGNGSVTIPYSITDGYTNSTSTITFNVHNTAPVAVTDHYTVRDYGYFSQPGEGPGDNDFDPDSDSFSITNQVQWASIPGAGGSYYNIVGGRISIIRSGTFVGTAVIGYEACDGLCSSGSILVNFLPLDGASDAGNSCPLVPVVARPVNPTSGNMWLKHDDYGLPGIGENIEISRVYNSVNQQSGIFGFGWTTKYDESLGFYGDKLARLNLPDGRAAYFDRGNTTESYKSVWNDIRGEITAEASEYRVKFLDGRIHGFSASGKLLWQKDRNGNQTTLAYDLNGLLITITDAFNRTLTINHFTGQPDQKKISDSMGLIATYDYFPGTSLLKSVTYTDQSKFNFEYDSTTAPGRILLKKVTDALGYTVETHDYDSSGRATTSEIHGAQEKYEFDYAHVGSSTPYTIVKHKKNTPDPYIETKYYFDKTRGRNVVTKTEGICGCSAAGSEVMQFFYDSKLNLTKKIDALGRETTNTFDNSGNLLTEADVVGTRKYTYNSLGEVLTFQDRIDSQSQAPPVYTQANTFDANGNLNSVTDALGNVTTIKYPDNNNKGLPEWIKDARNNITKFKWFVATGLLEEIEDPYTKKTKFTWDTRGRILTVTNALNHATTYDYHASTPVDRKVDITFPNLDKITYKYDIRRLLESVTDERGKVTAYEFDPQYRLKKITDPLGHIREYGYDDMSNLNAYTDPLGKVTNYAYDDFNRLKQIDHPAAETGAPRLNEKFEYDKVGRIKKYFDTANRLTEYNYSDTTRTNTVKNPELETTTIKYNQRFQTTEVIDAISQSYQFTYDPLGRMLTRTRAGTTLTYQYNEVGGMKKRFDDLGRETKYSYDNLNRLTEIEYLPPTIVGAVPSPIPTVKTTYGYDDISRLTSATNEMGTVSFNYDNRNRIKNTTDVFGHLLEYEYERTPTVNQQRLKFDGAMHAAYNFDDAGRLDNIVNSSDSTVIDFVFDADDRLESRAYPNGVGTSYSYFDNDDLKRITDTGPAGTLFDRQYVYNPARQISQIIEPSRSRTFGYDNVDRLTSVTDATNGNESYTFDDVGNRTTSHRSATYGYQPFNKLISTATSSYTFDANGNTTTKGEGSQFWRYTWDAENRLTRAGNRKQTVTYKFDAIGRRVQRVAGKQNTKFIYDGQDVVVDDNYGSLTKYQNGLGVDEKVRMQTGSDVSYFLADHLGSTNGLTDSTGELTASTAYDSFGNATNTSFSNRYQFTGREFDSFTRLQYSRARIYDSNIGRFLSEDPISFAGGDVNLYGYVWNNPHNFYDPFGLDGWGNDTADRLDGNINYARQVYKRQPEYWGWNGSVDTVADLSQLGVDPLRVGSGVGYALYAPNASGWDRTIAVAGDLGRTLAIAAPIARLLGRLLGGASPANANTFCQFSGTEKPWTRGATPNSVYTHVDDSGLAKQNAIYNENGKVIGHVDFKNHGSGAQSGHGHFFPRAGDPSSGHGRGATHIPPDQLPSGWGNLPAGIKPNTPIGQ